MSLEYCWTCGEKYNSQGICENCEDLEFYTEVEREKNILQDNRRKYFKRQEILKSKSLV
jgi:hypothetical protein